ncbi:MAG: sulfatase-like hydrolase/transferase [Bacteroidota bacterium]|nr:sulfatase-like hydrolase/transferase [Bacteroidota bacterium]
MKKRKPNILIIVSDQQVIDTISAYKEYFKHPAYLCHWANTPNFDRMIAGGYSFLESNSTNPVCCPARSSLFTGRYSTETGVTYNNIGIDKNVPNMGEWFETNADYKRIYCGKWHAGGQWNYPDIEGARKIPGFETIPVGVGGTGDFNDFQVSGAMKGFIMNYQEDKPFLAVAGLMNPHDICYWTPQLHGDKLVPKSDIFELVDNRPPLPPNYNFKFDDPYLKQQVKFTKEEWQNYLYDYCRMVEKVDADLGRMLDAVDSRNDETLVIFTSDHGEGAARHRRVQKWHPFEQSVKVPFIAYMPGRIKENSIDQKHTVSGIDLMTTVCDYAGIPAPPGCRGRSLRPIIEQGKSQEEMDVAFAEFQHTGRVVRKGDFKYVKIYEYSGEPDKPFVRLEDGQPEKFQACAGSSRYKTTSHQLLFNINNDPWELIDLSADPAYRLKMEELDTLLAEEWEKKMIPGTHFDRN